MNFNQGDIVRIKNQEKHYIFINSLNETLAEILDAKTHSFHTIDKNDLEKVVKK